MIDTDNRLINNLDLYNQNECCQNGTEGNQNENNIHNENTYTEIFRAMINGGKINGAIDGTFEEIKEICDMQVLTKKYC